VFFNWVKAHVRTQGNELADRLAKKAATEDIGEIVYDKIPRETIISEGKETGLTKWQELWASSTKGAISKLFFPSIKERMKTHLSQIYGYGNRSWFQLDSTSTASRLFPIQHALADYKKNRQLTT
jgi:hypothetical protein